MAKLRTVKASELPEDQQLDLRILLDYLGERFSRKQPRPNGQREPMPRPSLGLDDKGTLHLSWEGRYGRETDELLRGLRRLRSTMYVYREHLVEEKDGCTRVERRLTVTIPAEPARV
jgi:hypothetical protein